MNTVTKALASVVLLAALSAAGGCGSTPAPADEEVQSAICDHYVLVNGVWTCAYYHPDLTSGARYCYGVNANNIPYTCSGGLLVVGYPGSGGSACANVALNSGEMAIWTGGNYGADCEILPAAQYQVILQWATCRGCSGNTIKSLKMGPHAGALLFMDQYFNTLCVNTNPGEQYASAPCGWVSSIYSYVVQ